MVTSGGGNRYCARERVVAGDGVGIGASERFLGTWRSCVVARGRLRCGGEASERRAHSGAGLNRGAAPAER
jgi:hypothetical protein